MGPFNIDPPPSKSSYLFALVIFWSSPKVVRQKTGLKPGAFCGVTGFNLPEASCQFSMGMAAAASLSLLLLSSSTAAPKGEAEGETPGPRSDRAVSQEEEVSPNGGVQKDALAPHGTIQGPGYSCSPAFPNRQDVGAKGGLMHDQEVDDQEMGGLGLLLCNKTSSGPGFHWTEVARLAQTEVIQLQGGECETLGPAGFR